MAGTLARCINLRKSPVSVQLCGISVSGVIRAVAICLSRTCLWLVRGERAPAPFPYIILLFEFVANDWPLAPMLLSAGECFPFSPAIDLERLARHVATHDPPGAIVVIEVAHLIRPRLWHGDVPLNISMKEQPLGRSVGIQHRAIAEYYGLPVVDSPRCSWCFPFTGSAI
jgi:hypothetical protein